MKLALVIVGGQHFLGVCDKGLPPDDGTKDAPADSEIVLRNVAMVVYTPLPVASGIEGAQGIGVAPLLAELPLEEAPLMLEYGDVAPGWKLLTVDPGNPPEDDLVRRYLRMFAPRIVAGDGKPPSLVTEAERSGASESAPRRVRLI